MIDYFIDALTRPLSATEAFEVRGLALIVIEHPGWAQKEITPKAPLISVRAAASDNPSGSLIERLPSAVRA